MDHVNKNDSHSQLENTGDHFQDILPTTSHRLNATVSGCVCCFEQSDNMMIQCCDGHTVCDYCLNNYAREVLFVRGKSNLECIGYECTKIYSYNELTKILKEDSLKKLCDNNHHKTPDDVSNNQKKSTQNSFQCIECGFVGESTLDSKIAICTNCGVRSCKHCQVKWDFHSDKKCKEKWSSDAIRLEYEEKMTQVVVRQCPQCCCDVIKSSGCNHITCICGCEFCFICGQEIAGYHHFYNSKCRQSSGMKNSHIENRLKKLKEEARKKKRAHGLDNIEVGPSSSRKRRRRAAHK